MKSWLKNIPVRRKLSLLSALSTGGALLVAGICFAAVDQISARNALLEELMLQMKLTMSAMHPALEFEDEQLARRALSALDAVPGIDGARVTFDDGYLMAATGEFGQDAKGRTELQQSLGLTDGRRATLTAYVDFGILRGRTIQLLGILVLVKLAAMLLSSLLARSLQQMITGPIEELARVMRQVSEKRDYTIRAQPAGNDEVGDIVEVFNEMLTTIAWNEEMLEHNVEERTLELRDEIQRRKRVERDLRRAMKKSEELGNAKAEFLANMSHEIRTPLIGVIGMAELLQDTELDDSQGEYVETLVGSSGHLLTLVNDILDFTRLQADGIELERVDFDLAELSHEVVGLLYPQARDRSVEIAVGFPSTVPHQVKGDPARVRQALTNLLGNAVKFTREGSIVLRFELLRKSESLQRVRISVEDTGIGIPDEKLNDIFDQFTQADASTTRQYGGTGLGLAITQNLVRLMDGTIRVRSREGAGTTFEVELPFGIAEQPRRLPWPEHDWTGARAVIAMADGGPTDVLRGMLEELGLIVYCVGAPTEGELSQRVERLLERSSKPAVVLADAGSEPHKTLDILRQLAVDMGERTPWFTLLADAIQIARDEQLHRLAGGSVLRKPVRRSEVIRLLDAASRENEMESVGASMPRVLLAEDNLVNQRICGAMLERCGFRVDVVSDGEEAVIAVQRASDQPFDMILMDAQMPKKDGLSATREIRAAEGSGARCLIVGMLSSDRSALEDACRRAGMDEVLSKPVTLAKLEALCRRHFPLSAV